MHGPSSRYQLATVPTHPGGPVQRAAGRSCLPAPPLACLERRRGSSGSWPQSGRRRGRRSRSRQIQTWLLTCVAACQLGSNRGRVLVRGSSVRVCARRRRQCRGRRLECTQRAPAAVRTVAIARSDRLLQPRSHLGGAAAALSECVTSSAAGGRLGRRWDPDLSAWMSKR